MAIIKDDTSYYSKQATTGFFKLSRISRTKYLLFSLWWIFIAVLPLIFISAMGTSINDWGIVLVELTVFALFIIYLLIFIKFLILTIRRLHDCDLAAWWVLLIFIPFIGEMWVLALFIIPGTQGDNRYGPQS